MVAGGILFIWITLLAIQITLPSVSTAIVDGRCMLWYAHNREVGSLIIVTSYFLPLMWMVICYSRIVYALKTKVT